MKWCEAERRQTPRIEPSCNIKRATRSSLDVLEVKNLLLSWGWRSVAFLYRSDQSFTNVEVRKLTETRKIQLGVLVVFCFWSLSVDYNGRKTTKAGWRVRSHEMVRCCSDGQRSSVWVCWTYVSNDCLCEARLDRTDRSWESNLQMQRDRRTKRKRQSETNWEHKWERSASSSPEEGGSNTIAQFSAC